MGKSQDKITIIFETLSVARLGGFILKTQFACR